jgi:hypothetical protein
MNTTIRATYDIGQAEGEMEASELGMTSEVGSHWAHLFAIEYTCNQLGLALSVVASVIDPSVTQDVMDAWILSFNK